MTRQNKVRINFDVPASTATMLTRIAEQQGSTKAEIMRRAIELAKAVFDARRDGMGLAVTDGAGAVLYRVAVL